MALGFFKKIVDLGRTEFSTINKLLFDSKENSYNWEISRLSPYTEKRSKWTWYNRAWINEWKLVFEEKRLLL